LWARHRRFAHNEAKRNEPTRSGSGAALFRLSGGRVRRGPSPGGWRAGVRTAAGPERQRLAVVLSFSNRIFPDRALRIHRASWNSSGETPAILSALRRVPRATSRCMGMTQPRPPFRLICVHRPGYLRARSFPFSEGACAPRAMGFRRRDADGGDSENNIVLARSAGWDGRAPRGQSEFAKRIPAFFYQPIYDSVPP